MTRLPLVVSVLLICLSPACAQQVPLQKKIFLTVDGKYDTPDGLVGHSLTDALADITGIPDDAVTGQGVDRVPPPWGAILDAFTRGSTG